MPSQIEKRIIEFERDKSSRIIKQTITIEKKDVEPDRMSAKEKFDSVIKISGLLAIFIPIIGFLTTSYIDHSTKRKENQLKSLAAVDVELHAYKKIYLDSTKRQKLVDTLLYSLIPNARIYQDSETSDSLSSITNIIDYESQWVTFHHKYLLYKNEINSNEKEFEIGITQKIKRMDRNNMDTLESMYLNMQRSRPKVMSAELKKLDSATDAAFTDLGRMIIALYNGQESKDSVLLHFNITYNVFIQDENFVQKTFWPFSESLNKCITYVDKVVKTKI